MPAEDSRAVTIGNYVRAESDLPMRGYIAAMDCFGRRSDRRTSKPMNEATQLRSRLEPVDAAGGAPHG